MTKLKAHVSQKKKDTLKKLVDLLSKNDIIGIVNLEELPTPQLQNMKKQLRGTFDLFITKKTIIKLALEQIKDKKPDLKKLEEHMKGMPALLFTKENPFLLFKTLKKNKSPAAAKPGQTAPRDLMVSAGPTPFTPGPIISELGALGLKAGVEGGKVVIKQDKIVCKEGEKISEPIANLLQKLGVEPMEIGLNLTCVYEKGIIYPKNVLDIDEKEFMNKLTQASQWATNLAVEVAYPTKEIIELLLQKAFKDSKAVALEANILEKDVIDQLLAKAESQATSVKQQANI